MKVTTQTDKGERALSDIQKAIAAMTPEQVSQFSWMAAGMAIMAGKPDQPPAQHATDTRDSA